MDLGFGDANQVVGDAAARALLQTTQAQERALDEELRRCDAVLEGRHDDGETTLERIRERRLQQMKQAQKQRQQWKTRGHGAYRELLPGQGQAGDTAKAFFEAAKQSERLVVHFYRPTTRLCDVFHGHLEKLAQRHLETKFVKINVEHCETGGGGASFLVERLGIVVMPTLVIVKDRKVVHHLHGFDELGGTEDFSTQALGYVLGEHGALTPRDDEVVEELVAPARSTARRMQKESRAIRDGIHSRDYDEDV